MDKQYGIAIYSLKLLGECSTYDADSGNLLIPDCGICQAGIGTYEDVVALTMRAVLRDYRVIVPSLATTI